MSSSIAHSKSDIQFLVETLKSFKPVKAPGEERETERSEAAIFAVIRPLDGQREYFAVTRDVSINGFGFVTKEPIESGQDYGVEFPDLSANSQGVRLKNKVCAECAWCLEIGTSLWISGWKLIGST